MKCLFEGCAVALVTPFKGAKIDYLALERIILRDIEKGARAIVILATTGEGVTISAEEREKIISFCRRLTLGKAQLIVGTGNNNFETCFSSTKMARDLGADGALVVSPYYNKTTQRGLIEYYKKLAELHFPIIIYNVPSRTGLTIELETIEKLVQTNEWIYGIKESTTDISRIAKLCEICKDKIAVYSGEDALNYIFYCMGAQGAISVTANLFADKVQKVFEFCLNQNFGEALSVQRELFPIDDVLFCETNPIPIKYFMSLANLTSAEVRLPLVPLSNKNKTKVKQVHLTCKSKGWIK